MLSQIERGKNKYEVTGPKGSSEFCFPEALSVSHEASYYVFCCASLIKNM